MISPLWPREGIQDSPGIWIARRGIRIPTTQYWTQVFLSETWILDSNY